MTHYLHGSRLQRAVPTSLLEILLRAEPTSPWLTFHLGQQRACYSYGDIVARARAWAAAFHQHRIVAGANILVVMPNTVDLVGAFFGAQLIGAVPVLAAWPASLRVDPARLSALTARCHQTVAPAAVVCLPEYAASFDRVITTPQDLGDALTFPVRGVGGEDVAFLQFTSGTEGESRAIVITHAAAAYSAHAMAEALDLGPTDVGVSWLPLFHDMGLVGSLFTSLAAGFPLHVMTPPEFLLHPERWLSLLATERATLTVAPNFAYDYAARRVRSDFSGRLDRLRHALNGSEPVQRATIASFEQRFAALGFRTGVLHPVYGLAEATLGVSFELGLLPDFVHHGRPIPSVGPPLPGIDISVRDSAGFELAEQLEGEIWIRGPSIAHTELCAPDRRRSLLIDGWLRTGDRGLKNQGRLYVTGRDKEIFIRGGRKYSPFDIERVAARVANAPPNGAIALSAPDPSRGTEALFLFVECPAARRASVEAALPGAMLAELGIRPDRLELIDPGALPRTSSGKLRRESWAREVLR